MMRGMGNESVLHLNKTGGMMLSGNTLQNSIVTGIGRAII